MEKRDIIVITALFLIAFFLFTMPVHKNPMPFGEGDGAYFFGTTDNMYKLDASPRDRPFYIYATWYSGSNRTSDPKAPLYPPTYFMIGTFFQIFGNRFTGFNMYIALTSMLIVFSTEL